MPDPSGARPDRNLAMELVRVTEYGAMAAARWVGLGEKESADGAASSDFRPSISVNVGWSMSTSRANWIQLAVA